MKDKKLNQQSDVKTAIPSKKTDIQQQGNQTRVQPGQAGQAGQVKETDFNRKK